MAITSSSGISFSGLGSGIDTDSLVAAIIGVDKARVTTMQNKITENNATKKIWTDLATSLSELQTKMNDMATATSNIKSVVLSNSDYFTATASNNTANTNYTINIEQIAKAHIITSSQQGSISAALGISGPLTINGTDINIDVNDSLNAIMAKVNSAKDASGNALGVSASIIDGRLMIQSKNTGSSNTINFSGAAATSLGIYTLQNPQDAKFTVNGLSVVRSSNTISDVISGITLNLKKPNSGDVSVSVVDDLTNAKKQIKDMFDAINKILTKINSLQKVDTSNPEKPTASAVASSRTLQSVEDAIVNTFQGSISGNNGLNYLFQIGISINRDGTFDISDSKLDKALQNDATAVFNLLNSKTQVQTGVTATQTSANSYTLGCKNIVSASDTVYCNGTPLARVTSFSGPNQYMMGYVSGTIDTSPDVIGTITADFSNTVTSGAYAGLLANVNNLLAQILDKTNGSLVSEQNNIDTRNKSIQKDIDRMNDRITAKEAMLRAQYQKMDELISSLKNVGNYISQYTDSLSKQDS